MRIHTKIISCTIITLVVLFQTESFADLNSTYAEFISNNGLIINKELAGKWIARFEKDLADANPNNAIYYQAKGIMADLYQAADDLPASVAVREELLNHAELPASIRIDSGLKLIAAAERNTIDPSKLLQISVTVNRLAVESKQNYNNDNYAPQFSKMRFKCVRWMCAEVRQEALRLKQQGRLAEANAKLTASLSEALQLSEDYIRNWAALSDYSRRYLTALNYAPDAMYYLQGEICDLLGALYDSGHNPILAKKVRQDGRGILEGLLEQYPTSRFSQAAAVLIIKFMKSENVSDPQIVAYIRRTVPRLSPNHSILNLVSDLAMEYSRKRNSELLANELFGVVLQQEESWFPSEFGSHINYQVCLLENSMNCIRLGSLKTVGDNLRKIKQLKNLDPGLKKRLVQVEEAFQRKFDADLSTIMQGAQWQGDADSPAKTEMKVDLSKHHTTAIPEASGQTNFAAGYIWSIGSLTFLCVGGWFIKWKLGRHS